MEPTKKISYRSLTEKMSETELKHIVAGSGENYVCNCSDPEGEYPKDNCKMGGGCSVYYPESCIEICLAWWGSNLSCEDFKAANC